MHAKFDLKCINFKCILQSGKTVGICSFINVRPLMLSIVGQGMLSNAVHPCWIVQVGSEQEQQLFTVKGDHSSGFQDLTIQCENFSLPPTTFQHLPAPTRTLCDVSALALGLNFEDPGSQPSPCTGTESVFDGLKSLLVILYTDLKFLYNCLIKLGTI